MLSIIQYIYTINLNITDHTHHTQPNITFSFQSIIVCNGMASSLALRDPQLSWKQPLLSLFIVDRIAQVLLCKQTVKYVYIHIAQTLGICSDMLRQLARVSNITSNHTLQPMKIVYWSNVIRCSVTTTPM